ncbi:hypothetical protein C0583_00750 [Candidatus Parcubacteria bacterium]|nr:MAG: hypothetical protein C0583_00750 [Candidatus Parcubacteria bacterium]
MKIGNYLLLFFSLFLLSSCSETVSFEAGDIKDDFCGVHLNYQYCKCAFHNDFCDQIAMSKKEAKKYVNEQYDKWLETELADFEKTCTEDNGIFENKKCKYCGEDELASEGKCISQADVLIEEDGIISEEGDEGECKYDSDCKPICEGNTMWKMGCNPRLNMCEKTFDTNCRSNSESFGDMIFSMVCSGGECVRDLAAVDNKRQELEEKKKKASDSLKDLNKKRDDLNVVMLESNKNCLNGIADMTNVAIVEFATRVASISTGGVPDLASVSVDYVNDALNRLGAYANGEPEEEEKKLKPDEYIKINCDLYKYFSEELASTDQELDELLEEAKSAEASLELLPS